MSIQEAVKRLRSEMNITQVELSKLLHVNCSTIIRWEKGKSIPNKKKAVKLLEIAREASVSSECVRYLAEVVNVSRKRSKKASNIGFPNIDEDLLCQVIDEAENAVCIIDSFTKEIVYLNKMMEEIVGESFFSSKDKHCYSFAMHNKEICDWCPFEKTTDCTHYQRLIDSTDGKNRRYLVNSKQFKWNGRDLAVSYISDVTNSNKRIEELYSIINDSDIGIVIYNYYNDGSIELLFVNDGYYKIIGKKRNERLRFLGKNCIDAIHPDDRGNLIKMLEGAFHQNGALEMDLRMLNDDNEYVWLKHIGIILKNDDKKMTIHSLFSRI